MSCVRHSLMSMKEQPHTIKRASPSPNSAQGFHIAADASTPRDGPSKKTQQPRQLLSCTKCRERKVKCDRTKPCTACCARGAPKECKFVAEGGDYAPIQQSYEIRKLRSENLRLKERLRAYKIPIDGDESDQAASPESHPGERPGTFAQKRRSMKQRRFKASEWSESIYFGSPGLANAVVDWANINLAPTSTQSLVHLMPRGPEMYTAKTSPPHPFATLFKATPDECIPELLSCLPKAKEIFLYLDVFKTKVNICAFPCIPMELTRGEIERFLSNIEHNAGLCPDMLALLFAALALGAQYSASTETSEKWKPADVTEAELQKGNVYIAAAMQALRLASFMHKPSLLGIQALIMIGPFLTNTGRFLDAWTLFGTTIRLAHSIGLHRHPKYLDPAPLTQKECSLRQTLWWWMLHMDQEYSMTLGRPLGISGLGDCPPPLELTTDPWILRFSEFVNHFTLLARQILSSDRLTNPKIDEFTDLLRSLLETMPEILQFDKSWLEPGWPERKDKPEWPLDAMAAVFYCKTHTYLILLNRQRLGKQGVQSPTQHTSSVPQMTTSHFQPANNLKSDSPSSGATNGSLRGLALVLSSSEEVLTAFVFLYHYAPAALACWTIGQQAFNACMILLLDALDTTDAARIPKVSAAYVVFQKLQAHGVHELANLAVDRISWGLAKLSRIHEQPTAIAKKQEVGLPRSRVGGDITIGDAGKSEAAYERFMHDTIMGNTGMFLLEDPGLQSSVPEAFSPLTWASADNHGHGSDSHQQHNSEHLMHHNPFICRGDPHLKEMESSLSTKNGVPAAGRPSERMQGSQGSTPGSAPQHATFGTELFSPEEPPQGPLSSPSSLATGSVVEQHNRSIEIGLEQFPPPFPRHHSYPFVRQRNDGPEAASRSSKNTEGVLDSIPTFPHFSNVNPFQATTSGSVIRQITGEHSNLDPWTARSALPISPVSEPALIDSHQPSAWGHSLPRSMQHNTPMPTWQYAMPFNLSSATGANVPAPAAQYEMEGRRGWLASSKAG